MFTNNVEKRSFKNVGNRRKCLSNIGKILEEVLGKILRNNKVYEFFKFVCRYPIQCDINVLFNIPLIPIRLDLSKNVHSSKVSTVQYNMSRMAQANVEIIETRKDF